MFFAVFMIIAAMIGGWWMFKLSDQNYEMAALFYGAIGVLWVGACLTLATYSLKILGA